MEQSACFECNDLKHILDNAEAFDSTLKNNEQPLLEGIIRKGRDNTTLILQILGSGYVGDIAVEIPIAAIKKCDKIMVADTHGEIHRITVDPKTEVKLIFTAEKLLNIIRTETPIKRGYTRYDYEMTMKDISGSMYIHPNKQQSESSNDEKGQRYSYVGSNMPKLRGTIELRNW